MPRTLISMSFGELAAELGGVDAMLGGFVGTDENHGDIVAVEGGELGIFVDVHFTKSDVKFAKERSDDLLGVVTKVTAGTGVESDFERARGGGHGLGWE
jgi:hypothetical protein